MKTRLIRLGLILLCAAQVFGQAARAAAPAAPGITSTNLPDDVLAALARKDLHTLWTNALLVDLFSSKRATNGLLEFLSDLNLRPKVFQASGGGSNDTALGFEFDYAKALTSYVPNPGSAHPIGLSLNVMAKGDVALDEDKNPNNWMEAGGGLHLFQGIGGVMPREDVANPTEQAKRLAYKIRAAAVAGQKVPDDVVQAFREVTVPQFFYDVQAHGKIETDQGFDNKQYAYGGQLGFVFRDWREDSGWGRFNLLDYPFALIRQGFAQEKGFHPSGRTFPSFVIGLDQVDPSENKARLAVDPDDDSYARLRVEIAFKTAVYKYQDQWLYVSAAFRHFQELGASRAIRDAKLDHTSYFAVVLDLPYHFNVSYAAGRLPLDRKDDDVFALGWTLNF
jgi:hypothetical protein